MNVLFADYLYGMQMLINILPKSFFLSVFLYPFLL